MEEKKEFTERLGQLCKLFHIANIAQMEYVNLGEIETVKITFTDGNFTYVNVSRDSTTMLFIDVISAVLQVNKDDADRTKNLK